MYKPAHKGSAKARQIREKQALSSPGPASYEIHKADDLRSDIVRISRQKFQAPKFALGAGAKSDLDMTMRRGRESPAPHDYGNSSNIALKTSKYKSMSVGGSLSKTRGPNMEDLIRRGKAQYPGPGAYGFPTQPDKMLPPGGRFSTSHHESATDYEARIRGSNPGPGDYVLPDHSIGGKGAKFGNAPLSHGSMYGRAPATPAPGQYKSDTSSLRDAGGRISNSKRTTNVDALLKDATAKPGPGLYQVSSTYGAFNNRHVWAPFKDYNEMREKRISNQPPPPTPSPEPLLMSLHEGLMQRFVRITTPGPEGLSMTKRPW